MEEPVFDLTFSWLLLLPAIAMILVCTGVWNHHATRVARQSKTSRSRLSAKKLLRRALIVNLFLATLIIFIMPLSLLPGLAGGVFMTAILMIPVLVYLLIVKHRERLEKTLLSGLRARSSTNKKKIGEPAIQTRTASTLAREVFASDNAVRMAGEEITPAKSYGELIKLVASLQMENIKLQRLVLVQKTAISTGISGHPAAREAGQDNTQLLLDAKEAARVAIRVARSERQERLRLEAENARIRRKSGISCAEKCDKETEDT